MTPEEREILNRSIELAEENNKILKGIRRSARFSSFVRIIYWAIIIGTAFGTYYFIQPYIDPLIKGYNGIKDSLNSVKNTTTNFPSLPNIFGGKK
jgi:hypothetical protein